MVSTPFCHSLNASSQPLGHRFHLHRKLAFSCRPTVVGQTQEVECGGLDLSFLALSPSFPTYALDAGDGSNLTY